MSEFDQFAGKYENLLSDPVRDIFAPGSAFFVTRKLDVLLAFAAETGIDTSRAAWADVGCGKGELLRAGRARFASVAGCDVSADMIRDCADVNARLQTDENRLPFEDESADLVTAVCVFHHVNPALWVALTKDICRVLRPGGLFAMIEHNPLNPAVQLVVRRTPVDEHAILLRSGRARQVMRDAGLAIAGTRFFLCVPERLFPWLGGLERAVACAPLGGQYCVFGKKLSGSSGSSAPKGNV